jgi:hypothetical protein
VRNGRKQWRWVSSLTPESALWCGRTEAEVRPVEAEATRHPFPRNPCRDTLDQAGSHPGDGLLVGCSAGRPEAALPARCRKRGRSRSLLRIWISTSAAASLVQRRQDVADDAYLEATLAYPSPAKGRRLSILIWRLPCRRPSRLQRKTCTRCNWWMTPVRWRSPCWWLRRIRQPGVGLDFEFDLGADLPDERPLG